MGWLKITDLKTGKVLFEEGQCMAVVERTYIDKDDEKNRLRVEQVEEIKGRLCQTEFYLKDPEAKP